MKNNKIKITLDISPHNTCDHNFCVISIHYNKKTLDKSLSLDYLFNITDKKDREWLFEKIIQNLVVNDLNGIPYKIIGIKKALKECKKIFYKK